MSKYNLDDDIQSELREEASVPKPKKKWTGSDIILPVINDNKIVLKKIDDTTSDEYLTWLKQVMPFTREMLNIYAETGMTSTKGKVDFFETVVMLHAQRWLFGNGFPNNNEIEIKWS